MKKLLYLAMIAMLATTVLISCDKDDDDDTNPPTILSTQVSGDNGTITVTFDMGVYGNSAASEALSAASFNLSISGGSATIADYTVSHTAGEEIANIMVTYAGAFTGDEIVTVNAVSIYNSAGVMMSTDQQGTVNLAELGIIGEWYSSGQNVAPLLTTYFAVDSIYAKFNADQTYLVESFDGDGVMTEYIGTFVQTKSDVGNIYTIELNQSAPSAVTSEGIFEVTMGAAGYDMQYEVVQMEPDLGNSAPTPEGGFGSSNGGALGTINIQKYLKLN